MLATIKREQPVDPREAYILRMWILYLAAPGHDTRDDSGAYSLGEVGQVNERKISRMTPYSVAERVAE